LERQKKRKAAAESVPPTPLPPLSKTCTSSLGGRVGRVVCHGGQEEMRTQNTNKRKGKP